MTVKKMFGVTKMKNGKYMVQAIYPRSEYIPKEYLIGVFDSVEIANEEYRRSVPNGIQAR